MTKRNERPVVRAIVLSCWLGAAGTCLADVLVTKSGSRWSGEIIDEGTSYRIVKPGGSQMSFPKDIVREILTAQAVEAEFQGMLKQAHLGEDSVVRGILKFVADNGLTDRARTQVLQAAYSERSAAAKGSSAAYTSLAKWCGEYGMLTYAADCRRSAFQCGFPAKLAAAGDDQERLEKLASECREQRLPVETARCLLGEYERRKKLALTADAKWELGQWCCNWNIDGWREENQAAAVGEVTKSGDLVRLEKYLAFMGKDTSTSNLMSACARAVYGMRLKSAGEDPEALARLAAWCRLHGLDTEAAQAEAAALKTSRNDAKVREMLGYAHNESTGAWEKAPLWSVKVLRSVRAKLYTEERLGQGKLEFKSGGEDMELAIVQVQFRANYSPAAEPSDRLAIVRRTEGTVLSAFLMPEKDETDGPWVVFTSNGVGLTPQQGQESAPRYTSKPPGPGLDTLPHSDPFLWAPKDEKGAVLKFVRKMGFTAMAMRPQRETELELIFFVPKETPMATLRFHDSPPIEVILKPDNEGASGLLQ